MKVFFLNPPFKPFFSRSERSPQVAKSRTLYFPVWLAQSAAYIEKNGHTIDFADAVAQDLSPGQCLERIQRFGPGLVIMETSTASIMSDLGVVKKLKERLPAIKTALCGTHVSALPEWTLKACPELDHVIMGEYETATLSLIQAMEKGQAESAQGTACHTGGRIRVNPGAGVIQNLDDIPFASAIYKRFLNHKDYFFAAADYPGIMLMTGRGCPNQCVWCLFNQTLHGRRYRFRSPEKIIAEFEYIIQNFPDVKEIWIDDDTFTANRKHLHKVCELIIERKLKFKTGPFKWYCNARPPVSLESLKLMKKAGCRLIVVGFESGSEAILTRMKKGYTLDKGIALMQHTKKAGILVHGCFMVGNDGETKETMEQTLAHAKKLLPDSAQFYFVHPYPGTRYYAWAAQKGVLASDNFNDWLKPNGQHRCVINLPGLGAEQLEDFCNRAYKRYHFCAPYLFMKLKQLFTHPAEGIRSLRSALNFIAGAL